MLTAMTFSFHPPCMPPPKFTCPEVFFFNLIFIFLATPRSTRDPSSLTRDRTRAPAVEAWRPNHWTVREFLSRSIYLAYGYDYLRL